MPPKRYFDDCGSASASKAENDDSLADIAMEDIGEDSTLKEQSSSKSPQRRKKNNGPHVQTTLFISSLPFTATSTDLTTLFSDIGPLRRAFVVTEKETGKSKGVGYVTFAIHEDAKRAFEQMQGHSLDGKRKMKIEWATGRFGVGANESETIGENTIQASSSAISTKQKVSNGSERDADAVRTIIITGLTECKPAADNKSIYKRARKIGDVENVIYPAPSSIVVSEVSNDIAHVVYRTPNHAMTAVTKLHAHTFKGAQVSVVLKKRADGAARLEAHMRPETKAKRDVMRKKVEEEQEKVRLSKGLVRDHDLKPDINRGSRLIVRNLPFDVTDRDLRAIFLPFGPIYSIDVPQKVAQGKNQEKEEAHEAVEANEEEIVEEADKTATELAENDAESKMDVDTSSRDTKENLPEKQGRGRGFAFVWHVSRSDALNAIKGLNGTEIGHGAAEKAQVKAAKGKAGRDAAKKALESIMQKAQPARQVAVDWALSKKEWEQKKDESEAGDTDVEALDDEKEDDEEESDSEPVEIDGDVNEEDEEEEEKPSLPKPEEGTTLFIRNLPYQATEEELRNLFRSFGPLRYAKLTMDNVTKRAKGTAFVCFWQKESAEKALQQAHLVEQEAGTSSHAAKAAKKANPFSAPSILTADPSAPLTSQLSLHGRVLSIVEAVERTEANALANASQTAREKSDKRNTYLMREGVPMPGTPLATKLNEVEIDRRLANFQMRKTQLIKNPSLFISKTRLSVRQLPLFVTDKVLKRLAEHAVKRFDEQVEAGEREDLSSEELQESRRLAKEMQKIDDAADAREQGTEIGEQDEESKASASKKQQLKLKRKSALQRRRMTNKGGFVVAQSKVIRAKDRLDATTGIGRSHGYGFIEMVTFADALKVVRFANANGGLRKQMLTWYAQELGEMLTKMEKEQESTSKPAKKDDEFVARKRRIEKKKAQLEAGQVDVEEEGTRGGLLVAEFSIENVVTVKRRSDRNRDKIKSGRDRRSRGENDDLSKGDHMQNARTRLGKRSRGDDGSSSTGGRGEERASKKPRKPSTWNQKTKKGVSKQPFVVPTTTDNGYRDRKQRANASTSESSEKKGSVVGSIIGRKRKMRQGKK